MSNQDRERIECTVGGILHGGRAICGYCMMGGQYCSVKRGECNLQKGAELNAADGVQAAAIGSASHD